MAVSAISGSATSYPPAAQQSEFRQDFRKLIDSITAGDLSGAQQAYSALAQAQDAVQGPASDPNSPFAKALNQIGQALQNGDLSGAQQAIASLSQQSQGAHRHHHHHHGGSSSSDASAVAATPATTGPGSSGVDLRA